MSSVQEGIMNRSTSVLSEISDIKSEILKGLDNVNVRIDVSKNTDLAKAIDSVFGEPKNTDKENRYLTFDMYMHCVKIIRSAGKAKSASIIGKRL